MKILVPYLHLILSFALLVSGIFWNVGFEIPLAVFVAVWCGGLITMRLVWPSLHEEGPNEGGFYVMLFQLALLLSFLYWLHLLGVIALAITLAAFIAFSPLKRRKKRSKEPGVS